RGGVRHGGRPPLRQGGPRLGLVRRNFVYGGIREQLLTTLDEIRAAGLYKGERVITSPQAPWIEVGADDARVLNLCANNYLGLADDPRVIAAAKDALDRWGY